MKKLVFLVWISSCLLIGQLQSQNKSPDKFINQLKKDDSAMAFTFPGWFVRLGANIAKHDMDEDEAAIIKELSSHIKKIRFVVLTETPENYRNEFNNMKSYLQDNTYESLVSVNHEDAKVDLWAKFDNDDIIRNIIISVFNEEEESVFFNINSDISLTSLSKMDFFKEWKSL